MFKGVLKTTRGHALRGKCKKIPGLPYNQIPQEGYDDMADHAYQIAVFSSKMRGRWQTPSMFDFLTDDCVRLIYKLLDPAMREHVSLEDAALGEYVYKTLVLYKVIPDYLQAE